jgi:hypothetical protein
MNENVRWGVSVVALLAAGLGQQLTRGQSVGFSEVRPFVTALIPVVGPSGAVGGISIDAHGVLAVSGEVETKALARERRAALVPLDSEIETKSECRKISLRGLQEAIQACRIAGRPLGGDLLNLAGLTRVQFVFVDPEQNDIVLAGPAEGWRVDECGNVVARTSGQPMVQLDDLVVALRTSRAAAKDRGISCSIDPSEEGLERLRPLLSARGLNEAAISRLEAALGPQQITITGVPESSHFARVMVAADFLMKRLGMGFERSPIDGLPSYLAMLTARTAAPPKNAMPRWWMAPHYEALLKDPDGLAWELRGGGVQTLTEDGYLDAMGTAAAVGREEPLAKRWAAAMTENYAALAMVRPVFAELRNCVDLAVVAALIDKERLAQRARCELSLLLDERQLAIGSYPVPKTVASRASLVRKGSGWILSLSGGVQVDSWRVASQAVNGEVAVDGRQALVGRRERWWWD